MRIQLLNLRGNKELSKIIFTHISMTPARERLSELLGPLKMPGSGIDTLYVVLDENQPPGFFSECRIPIQTDGYSTTWGFDAGKFTDAANPGKLREFVLDCIDQSLKRISLPPGDTKPVLEAFRTWRSSLADADWVRPKSEFEDCRTEITQEAANRLSAELELEPFLEEDAFSDLWVRRNTYSRRVEEFLDYYELGLDEDRAFALMKLIIRSLNRRMLRGTDCTAESERMRGLLNRDFALHRHTIYQECWWHMNSRAEEKGPLRYFTMAIPARRLMREIWLGNGGKEYPG